MRIADRSLVLTLLLSPLIFFFCSEVQARTLLQSCSSSCGDLQNISYPFRLKGDPASCGDPDYELSCENGKTILELHSGKYLVKKISYEQHVIRVVDFNLANASCSLPYYPLSVEEVADDPRYWWAGIFTEVHISFMNCSAIISNSTYIRIRCLSGNTSHVYVRYDSYSISDLPEVCKLISMVPAVPEGVQDPSSYGDIVKILESGFDLTWSVECRDCLSSGASCELISDVTPFVFECYKPDLLSSIMNEIVFLVSALADILLVLIIIVRLIIAPVVIIVFLIHKYRTTKKPVDPMEKIQHNHRSLMPKRYSFTDLVAMTNHFKDKLGQGGFGSVYKGQLLDGRFVAVKMLAGSKSSAEEFINEVSTIGRIHHVNVAQLVGFCSEESKLALVYEYMPNGSLDKHIFPKEEKVCTFTWKKLYEIALGTAQGIEYLHRGCDVCILHFDIKPHNVLLDDGFIPKISDFGLAKFYPKEYDFVSVNTMRGTIGYIAPELISRNSGAVSCRSDVYSFGMLLLEMVGGRKNMNREAQSSSEVYFPSWVYDHLSKGGDLELENVTEIEVKIAKKLCIVGLWCIQFMPSDRPSMTKVVEMLEGNFDDLMIPPKHFSPSPQRIPSRDPQSDSSTEVLLSELTEKSVNIDPNV